MLNSNFKFLAAHQPKLYELGLSAESYAYSDPESAVVKLRCFAEIFVGFIYQELKLPALGYKGFFERIENNRFARAVEECVLDKLHLIRIKGNKAAHLKGVTVEEALLLIKEAWFLGAWLFIAYHEGKIEQLPEFNQPKPSNKAGQLNNADLVQIAQGDQEQLLKLKIALNLKTADLENAMKELNEIKHLQSETQQKMEALNIAVDEVKYAKLQKSGQQFTSYYDFEKETTLKNIDINEFFASYQLTDGQTVLIKKLNDFLMNPHEKVFMLKGYAGTGKTFITKGLTEYLKALKRTFLLLAPTGKAAKVIAEKTGNLAQTLHKTIYTFNELSEFKDDTLDGSETYKFYAKIAVNLAPSDSVYIVDESSMFSDSFNDQEFFRCGSGYLLRDFFKFINFDDNDHQKKVIFIGDDAQLPPVGMRFSPALSQDYLAQEYGLKSTVYELTEVVRQKIESGVMLNANNLRKAMQANVFNQLDINLNFPDIDHLEHSDFLTTYMNSCQHKIGDEAIVLSYSNKDVLEYNKCIREQFFPGQQHVCAGDKLNVVANTEVEGIYLSNGDFVSVNQILSGTESRVIPLKRKNKETGAVEQTNVPLSFRDVLIEVKLLSGDVHYAKVKIIENLLYSDSPALNSVENKALYVDFCMRNSKLARGSKSFLDTLRADPYFNALKVKFGYAITVHKAQGSEWNHVFIKCKTHLASLSADYFRWFYTAMTRTVQQLYLMDTPHIQLGSGIKMVGNFNNEVYEGRDIQPISINMHQIDSSKTQQIVKDTIMPSDQTSAKPRLPESFGIPSSNLFLVKLLDEINQLIGDHHIEIDAIQHNQYQEAYYFRCGNEQARINIAYNGKEKISNLNSTELSELSSTLLNLLAPLKGRVLANLKQSQPSTIEPFEEDFLNQYYRSLKEKAIHAGMELSVIHKQQYAIRLSFQKNNETAVFDIYFNGKKQFTKCSLLPNLSNSHSLANEAFQVLTFGAG